MKKAILLILGSVLIGFASCEYKFIEPDTGDPVDPDEPISFSAEVVPIWSTQSCTNCHNGGTAFSLASDGAYQSLTTRGLYDVDTPENSVILEFPSTGHGGGYSGNQSEVIRVWIEQGAQDN